VETTETTETVEAPAIMESAKLGSFTMFRKWLSRSADEEPTVAIEPGELYGHMVDGRSVELARIIDVATDEFGIQHIRFLLGYRYQHKIVEAGERTLPCPSSPPASPNG
jgi:hypothetical protein